MDILFSFPFMFTRNIKVNKYNSNKTNRVDGYTHIFARVIFDFYSLQNVGKTGLLKFHWKMHITNVNILFNEKSNHETKYKNTFNFRISKGKVLFIYSLFFLGPKPTELVNKTAVM